MRPRQPSNAADGAKLYGVPDEGEGRHGTMNEFVRRLTEGPAIWGRVSVWPHSPGLWERYTLTVYPPGTSAAERRALQFARSWPIVGALVGAAGLIALWPAWPLLSVAFILSVYIGGLWAASRITRRLGGRMRRMRGDEIFVAGVMTEYGDLRRLRSTLALLTDLEERRRSGDINPVQYEAEWSVIYDSVLSDESLPV